MRIQSLVHILKMSVFLIGSIFVINVIAADIALEKRVYYAHQVNPHAPTIDGKEDDPVWRKAGTAGDFIQFEPQVGAPPTEQTVFKIAYDAKNLYVFLRARDSQPHQICTRLTRRDEETEADRMGIMIDSYFDHLTAFEFGVNAAGVKFDAIYSQNGDVKDTNWDPVWYVETVRDDSGWTAEMKIPFSQLRFKNSGEQVWGLEVYRELFRNKELSLWQSIPKDAAGFIHKFGELRGISGIHLPRRVELLPYSVSNVMRSKPEHGNPFATGQKRNLAVGMDGKIGLTSDLTLDYTINPDFGQVEADPSEVNLTAFETFFEEKRPFFIEGKNIFDYRLMLGDGEMAQEMLFYSRRIGRSPHYQPDLGDAEYSDSPQSTSILGAFKLSGKTARGWSVGLLNAVTQEERAQIQGQKSRNRTEIVEPMSNYFVSRLKKDFNKGSTTIGGMLTTTHRKITETQLNFLNRSAYTGGFDFSHQWHNREYMVDFRTAFSHIRGHRDAILEAQTFSARYFQRPDAGHLSLDSSRTALSGHGGYLSVGKFGGGHFRCALIGFWRSPGLELNDVGFLREADQVAQIFWAGYRYWTPVWILRNINVNINQWQGWTFGREKTMTGGNINFHLQFTNQWYLSMGINRQGERYSVSMLRGGPALKIPANWNQWLRIATDERKAFQTMLGGFSRIDDVGGTRMTDWFATFSLRPADRIKLSISPDYFLYRNNLQYITTTTFQDQDRYVMAQLDQKTLGLVIRLNYSLSPNLSIQYYGQPYVAAGSYSNYKKITRSKAERYQDRFELLRNSQIRYNDADEAFEVDENQDGRVDYSFEKPDFNFKQFRSNLVLRWEYHPGSTLFLVWSQGRTGFTSNGIFSYAGDMDNLFHVYPENIFLLKVNHYFSF